MPLANPYKIATLLLLAGLSFAPIRYLWRAAGDRRARHGPYVRRRPTNWRTPWGTPRSILTLLPLAAAAAWLFTPAADDFGTGEVFWPALLALGGAAVLAMVRHGIFRGRMWPITGFDLATVRRDREPGWFWVSTVWNTLIGGLVLWIGVAIFLSAPHDARVAECVDDDDHPREQIAACSALLTSERGDTGDRADWFAARGSAHYRLRATQAAMADYRRSIRLDPNQRYTHYNLSLTLYDTRDLTGALREVDTAARLDPDDLDTRLRRTDLYLQTNQPQRAIDDLTDYHRRRPIEPLPIATRGLIHAMLRHEAPARADFAAARAIEPGNPVAIKGEAILALNAGDWPAAVRHLTAALERYPGDLWLLQLRSVAYFRMGDGLHANEDLAAIAAAARRR